MAVCTVGPLNSTKIGFDSSTISKTHAPGNAIRVITSGFCTAVEKLAAFTEYFLPCLKKEPQILIDTMALLNKIQVDNRFAPFPQGTLLVSLDVIAMYPSIDNEAGLSAWKKALDSRSN